MAKVTVSRADARHTRSPAAVGALLCAMTLCFPLWGKPGASRAAFVPPVPHSTTSLQYPPSEQDNPRDVDVELIVDVDASGHVVGAEIAKSGGAAFDAAAVRTITQWHFTPAQRGGRAVAVRIIVPVHFHAPHPAHRHADHRTHAHEPGAHGPHPEHEQGAARHHHAPIAASSATAEQPPKSLTDATGDDESIAPHAHADVVSPELLVPSTSVTAKATAKSAGQTTLSRTALADTNRKSAEDLVRRAPGIQVVQHGAEGKAPQFYVRGFDALHGSDIEVRLGRIPLNEPNHVHGHGYIDLALVIPELVEGIDVSPGAFDLRQGPFGTAASLRFRPGAAGAGVTIGAEGGWPQRGRAYTILALSKQRYIGVEGVSTRGFGQGRDAQRANVNAAWAQPIVPGLRLDAGVLASATRFSLPGAVRLDDVERGRVDLHDSYAPGSGQGVRALAHVGAKTRFDLGPTSARIAAQTYLGAKRLELNENYTGRLENDAWGDEVRQAQSHIDGGTVVDARWRVHRALAFTMLGEARHTVGVQGVAQGEQRLPPATGFASTHLAAGAGMTARLLAFAEMTLSLRADAFRFGNDDDAAWGAAVSPRARVVIRPGLDGVELFVAAGRGVRGPGDVGVAQKPGAEEMLAQLDPMRFSWGSVSTAEGGELGASFARGGFRAAALVFGTFNADELRFDHVARTTESVGASRRVGAQARADYDWAGWLTLGGDVTATDARFVDADNLVAVDTVTGGEMVAGVPPLMAALRMALSPFAGFRIGAHAQVLSPRPLRFGAWTRPVAIANGFARYTWHGVTVHAAVDNVLDAAYAEGAGMFASHWDQSQPKSQLPVQHLYAGSPRMFRLGLELQF